MEDIKAVAEELVAMTSDEVSKMNKELKERYQVYQYSVPQVHFEPHPAMFRCKHGKTEVQRKNEIAKRRKKNKNKKTHRK